MSEKRYIFRIDIELDTVAWRQVSMQHPHPQKDHHIWFLLIQILYINDVL